MAQHFRLVKYSNLRRTVPFYGPISDFIRNGQTMVFWEVLNMNRGRDSSAWFTIKLVGGLEQLFFHSIDGMSSSQLTFFFRGVETTNQNMLILIMRQIGLDTYHQPVMVYSYIDWWLLTIINYHEPSLTNQNRMKHTTNHIHRFSIDSS